MGGQVKGSGHHGGQVIGSGHHEGSGGRVRVTHLGLATLAYFSICLQTR